MEEIRLGTIGSGMIVHAILQQVKRTEGIRLVAVYSRSQEKGEALAAEFDAQRVYTDMAAFLADPEVNTVYIATPNLLHYAQAKQVLLAGKHVILEKPFTTKLSDAEELVRMAKERNLLLVDAVPPAYYPNFRLLQQQLPKIGQIKLVMSNYSQYSSRYDQVLAGEVPNIFNPGMAGGCLMDINFYNVYLNIALFGKPQQAVYYPNLYPGLADTSGVMVLGYDGFVSQNAGAKDTWGVNFFQIEGEQGYIYAENGANRLTTIRVVTKQEETVLNEQPEPVGWYYEVQRVTQEMLAEDYDSIYKRLDTMLEVMEVMEISRKAAGILFPGDE